MSLPVQLNIYKSVVPVIAVQVKLNVSIFRLDEVSHGLWILVGCWMVVSMAVIVVGVGVFSRADEVHLVDTTTFRAALYWAVTGDGKPESVMGVSGIASATEVSTEEYHVR